MKEDLEDRAAEGHGWADREDSSCSCCFLFSAIRAQSQAFVPQMVPIDSALEIRVASLIVRSNKRCDKSKMLGMAALVERKQKVEEAAGSS